MEMDKRIFLIGFTIILVLGVVFFNFEKFTGQPVITRPVEESTIYISLDEYNGDVLPSETKSVRAGNTIYLIVKVGSEGTHRNARISDQTQRGVGTSGNEVELNGIRESLYGCGGSKCGAPAVGKTKYVQGSYRIPGDWYGSYCAMVYDIAVEDYINACFTVY